MTGLSTCSCMKWVGKFKKNPSTKVFKKTGEIMLAVKPIFQFRWSHHWVVTLSRWPFLFHPFLKLEGDIKEPVTLFEKSRGRRPQCRQCIWLVPSSVWMGKGSSKHGLKWPQVGKVDTAYIYFLVFFSNLGWHKGQAPGVPENILTQPLESQWKFWGEVEVREKINESMKLNRNFERVVGRVGFQPVYHSSR